MEKSVIRAVTVLLLFVNTIFASAGATELTHDAEGKIIGPGESAEIPSQRGFSVTPQILSQTRNQVYAANNAGERAPDCVEATKTITGNIQVENKCEFDLRMKVIMAFDGDIACTLINHGETVRVGFRPNPLGRIDRLELC